MERLADCRSIPLMLVILVIELAPFVAVGLVHEEGVHPELVEVDDVFFLAREELYELLLLLLLQLLDLPDRPLVLVLRLHLPDDPLQLPDLLPDVGGFLLRGHGDHVEGASAGR